MCWKSWCKRNICRQTNIEALIKLTQDNNDDLVIDNSFYKLLWEQYFKDFNKRSK